MSIDLSKYNGKRAKATSASRRPKRPSAARPGHGRIERGVTSHASSSSPRR